MIRFLLVLLLILFIIILMGGILFIYYGFRLEKEYRYKYFVHIFFLIIDIMVGGIGCISLWIMNIVDSNKVSVFGELFNSTLILAMILIVYLLFKMGYKIYFEYYLKKGINFKNEEIPRQYYLKDNHIYMYENYQSLGKIFRMTIMGIIVSLSVILGFLYYIKIISFRNILFMVSTFSLLTLCLLEFSIYFDGNCEDEKLDAFKRKRKVKDIEVKMDDINKEYYQLWKNQIVGTYTVDNDYKYRIIENKNACDSLSLDIANDKGNSEFISFMYSRILNPIINGDDLIVESCLLESFSDIMGSIINMLFATNKKMIFICDTIDTVNNCFKWIMEFDKKININNSNIVVDVVSYVDNNYVKNDNNVDIYIGTVDLLLNSMAIYDNIDVVFGINIDRIISEDALNLNLLSSVLASNSDSVIQYVMFGNRVNGLKAILSHVFMRSNFKYQVIKNSSKNKLIANFFKTESGWLQLNLLPNFANQYLGQLIPIAIPSFKYNIKKVDVVASKQPYRDQMLSLQTSQLLMEKYLERDIVNIDEGINFVDNENFLEVSDKTVVVVGDTCNNASLVVLNWLKYIKGDMILNVVSTPYLLRDYIISNIDFFIGNAELIGSILPQPRNNIKLTVYKLINQLCYGNVVEDLLLREIQKQEMDIKIDMFRNEQTSFIAYALNDLTKKAFGVDITYSSYLMVDKNNSLVDGKSYYKLLDLVKRELPGNLFRNVSFIDSEQVMKVIKRVPVFELYQNYLEGQYISYDGKYYLIDKINYDNGVVDLIHSGNNMDFQYRQHRMVENVKFNHIVKDMPINVVRSIILSKKVMNADFVVNTCGYYEFNNKISFASGDFSYKEIDTGKKGLRREYRAADILVVNIVDDKILEMSDYDKFRLSFTLSTLLNELFETLFSNIKQYILVRTVVKDEKIYEKNKQDEIVKLYQPIIDDSVQDGINIYIMEDTELEKGIIDAIVNSFDNIIIKILYDYLHWLLIEDMKDYSLDDFISNNGDMINFNKIDKKEFIKFGMDEVSECFDLDGIYQCLHDLLINGSDMITSSRIAYIENRKIIDKKELEEKKKHDSNLENEDDKNIDKSKAKSKNNSSINKGKKDKGKYKKRKENLETKVNKIEGEVDFDEADSVKGINNDFDDQDKSVNNNNN